MTSFLQFNDENADRVASILDELKNYICEGIVPDAETDQELTGD